LGHARRVLDQRFGIAERHGPPDQLQPVHHALATLKARPELEGAIMPPGSAIRRCASSCYGKLFSPG
jgi:hypothetical protein